MSKREKSYQNIDPRVEAGARMTDEQIIELLATKVMEWRKENLHDPVTGWEQFWVEERRSGKPVIILDSWNPLKHIQHAWMVVEKLGRWHGFNFMIKHECFTWLVDQPVFWTAGWFEDGNEGPESRCSAESETVTRAICLAALKAHGIEV